MEFLIYFIITRVILFIASATLYTYAKRSGDHWFSDDVLIFSAVAFLPPLGEGFVVLAALAGILVSAVFLLEKLYAKVGDLMWSIINKILEKRKSD